jgi:hypothetical protein
MIDRTPKQTTQHHLVPTGATTLEIVGHTEVTLALPDCRLCRGTTARFEVLARDRLSLR